MRNSAYYRSVALVGTDGSGKTTQTELLRRLLAEGPRKARVFAVHPFGRKLLRVGVSSPLIQTSAQEAPTAKRVGSLRRLIAAADILDVALYLWLVRLVSTFAAIFGDQEVWVVGDRSMDDVLVKHQRQGTLSAGLVGVIRRLVPTFRLTIWLEVAPEVAMARDNDFELGYYEELYGVYSTAARRFGWRVVREDGRSPEGVFESIVEELAEAGIRPDSPERLRVAL